MGPRAGAGFLSWRRETTPTPKKSGGPDGDTPHPLVQKNFSPISERREEDMPTPSKRAANMSKHLTREEQEQRVAAEQMSMPHRGKPKRAGTLISSDTRAKAYWDKIWTDMEELEILDTLDAPALAGLCSMLSLRDRLARLGPELVKALDTLREQCDPRTEPGRAALNELAGLLRQANALTDKRLRLDAQILGYADKLGLTPSGRSRLAARRAAQEPPDEDDDLFG